MKHTKLFFITSLFFFAFQVIISCNPITITDGEFKYSLKKRTVPYRLYKPKKLIGKYPVIIFSHGLGGSKDNAEYLGRYLAKNSFLVFHIQHPGSDSEVWKGKFTGFGIKRALIKSLRNPFNAVNRFNDIPFVVDKIEEMNKTDKIMKNHIDISKIGLAGHSYGGRSTMIAAGERLSRFYLSYKEDRIKAGLVLSPNLPKKNLQIEKAYTDIKIPLFHMTGTKDGKVLPVNDDMVPEDRTKPYENLNKSPQFLLVLEGADHSVFSGSNRTHLFNQEIMSHYLTSVKTGALAFFKAFLNNDKSTLKWLKNDFIKTLDKDDSFKWKGK